MEIVMKYLKVLCGIGFFVVLVSNVWSITGWNEIRGVYDDICYLRQAHLFQKFGLKGLDTDISGDDDGYLTGKLKEIDFPTWSDATTAPCHTLMPATNKLVMQYPPGTGFMLALFPSGFQVIPLYVLTSVVAFGFAVAATVWASGIFSLLLVAAFGDAAIYLMINPTKASYSMAPTMMVCALAGFLTAKLFTSDGRRHQLVLTILIGLLMGLAVNFRLANLFLSAGYFVFFLVSFVRSRQLERALQGLLFGMAFLIGIAPTLLANAINAGSPFSTTYGGADVAPPELNSGVLWAYFADLQFGLLVIAGIWAALMLRLSDQNGTRQLALVIGGNLAVNLIFFMTHPVFTPYYTIPVAMLSLWTLLFATLIPDRESIGDSVAFRQPVKA
jgi:4-amino-4-deoxy-L-arabinose transferase-like glycosyltransferase